MSLGGLGSIKRLEDDGKEGERERDEKKKGARHREGEDTVSNHGLPWIDWSCWFLLYRSSECWCEDGMVYVLFLAHG